MRTVLPHSRLIIRLLVVIVLARIDGSGLPHISLWQDQISQSKTRAVESEVARWAAQLKSGDLEERRDAVVSLSRLDGDAALSALVSALSDVSSSVRAHVLTSLGERSDPKVVPLIVSRLASDKDPFVRKAAAYGLARFSVAERTAALITALKDKDPEVRGAAAVSLGDHPDSSAVAGLAASLSDKSEFIRAQAARALGVNGSSAGSAVPELVRLLDSDPEVEVKRQAAVALGLIGDRAALPALERASSHKDSYLSQAARDSIRMIEEK